MNIDPQSLLQLFYHYYDPRDFVFANSLEELDSKLCLQNESRCLKHVHRLEQIESFGAQDSISRGDIETYKQDWNSRILDLTKLCACTIVMFDKGLGNIGYVPLLQINRNNLNEVLSLFEDSQTLRIGDVDWEIIKFDYLSKRNINVDSIRDALTRRADSRKLRIESRGANYGFFSLNRFKSKAPIDPSNYGACVVRPIDGEHVTFARLHAILEPLPMTSQIEMLTSLNSLVLNGKPSNFAGFIALLEAVGHRSIAFEQLVREFESAFFDSSTFGPEHWKSFETSDNHEVIGRTLFRKTPFVKSILSSIVASNRGDVKYENYIYLISDDRNGSTKIGRSKNPKHREKTLQSEEPQITMRFAIPASATEETNLHRMYDAKRIRGEWFKLTDAEIGTVINYLVKVGNCSGIICDRDWYCKMSLGI